MGEYLLPCPLVRGTFQVEKKRERLGRNCLLHITFSVFLGKLVFRA